jgi:hypothetical protein
MVAIAGEHLGHDFYLARQPGGTSIDRSADFRLRQGSDTGPATCAKGTNRELRNDEVRGLHGADREKEIEVAQQHGRLLILAPAANNASVWA